MSINDYLLMLSLIIGLILFIAVTILLCIEISKTTKWKNYVRRIKRKRNAKKKEKTRAKGLFWKSMLIAIEIFGMYHVHLSYELAERGLEPVTDISTQIILYMVAPFITSIISKTIENVFEHNKLSFSEPIGGNIDGMDH